jgi:hypothetical protein
VSHFGLVGERGSTGAWRNNPTLVRFVCLARYILAPQPRRANLPRVEHFPRSRGASFCGPTRRTFCFANAPGWNELWHNRLVSLGPSLVSSGVHVACCKAFDHRGHQDQSAARTSDRVRSRRLFRAGSRPNSVSPSRPLPRGRNGSMRSSSTVSGCPRVSRAAERNC